MPNPIENVEDKEKYGVFLYNYVSDEKLPEFDGYFLTPEEANNYIEEEANRVIEELRAQGVLAYVELLEKDPNGEWGMESEPLYTSWNKTEADEANEGENEGLMYDEEGRLAYGAEKQSNIRNTLMNKIIKEYDLSEWCVKEHEQLYESLYVNRDGSLFSGIEANAYTHPSSMHDGDTERILQVGLSVPCNCDYCVNDDSYKEEDVETEHINSLIEAIQENINEIPYGFFDDETRASDKMIANKMSSDAQEFISKKIKYLIDKEGKSQEQAAAIAYSMAKKEGYDVPNKTKASEDIKVINEIEMHIGNDEDMVIPKNVTIKFIDEMDGTATIEYNGVAGEIMTEILEENTTYKKQSPDLNMPERSQTLGKEETNDIKTLTEDEIKEIAMSWSSAGFNRFKQYMQEYHPYFRPLPSAYEKDEMGKDPRFLEIFKEFLKGEYRKGLMIEESKKNIKADEIMRSWKPGSRNGMVDIMVSILFAGDYQMALEDLVQAMSDSEFFENYEFIKRMRYEDEEIRKELEEAEKEFLSE